MRAARIEELGRPPVLVEIEEPRRSPGQALVAPVAVPVNPIDIATANGTFYGGSPDTPYIPGSEAVGRVLEADSAGTGSLFYFSGDGLGRKRDGTLAERAVVAEDVMFALPAEISPELAGACGTAGLSGWLAVTWRAQVMPDDRVLVLGATGTVGLAAVQAAKIVGAVRIVAAGRRPDRLELAAELGADAVVNLNGADLPGAFREAAGGDGPTVVIDPLWGEPAVAALEAAANGARIVQLGQSAGATAEIRSATVRGKQLKILGYANPQLPIEVRRTGYLELLGHAAAGRVRFPIETYPLDRVAEAWERQAAGPGAKIVVTV
ncbi:MAG TPA: zinc-binding dehydrogenase [Gaiellaceae bacterium]|jgi:NADPH2:quinone reductase